MKTFQQFIPKFNVIFYSFLTLLSLGCNKDDDPVPQEIIKSMEKELISFSFLSSNNKVISADVVTSINTIAKTVTASLPSDTPLTTLNPTISVSPKAIVSPMGPQDFTNPVTYIITAEDGSTSSFEASLISQSSAKQITSFVFLLTNNPIDVNVVGSINEETNTITATMPVNTDVTGLLPEIKISTLATLSTNTTKDFTEPVVYTITAEDGSEVIYTVIITALLSQRQILQAILDINPETTVDWNLKATANLGDLTGISLNTDDEIIELNLSNESISILPTEMGQLTNLISLDVGQNQLTELPSEIGQLTNLASLSLDNNRLTSLLPEIGQLTNLTDLTLFENQLTSLPAEIGQLTNLTSLSVNDNQLTELPPEIGQLRDLVILSLSGSQLTSLPAEIGQLTNLTSLDVGQNQLTELPPEIGFLTNLSFLSIRNSTLNTIPIAICNLKTYNNPSMIFRTVLNATCTTISKIDALISIYSANPDNSLGWSVDNFPEVVFNDVGNPVNITMNNKNLTRIPNSIAEFTELETLNVNSNNLVSLPDTLANLVDLNTITVANNNLSTVPSEFGQLNNLALLSLTQNPITSIPQEVCDLQTSNDGILTILTDPGEGCN